MSFRGDRLPTGSFSTPAPRPPPTGSTRSVRRPSSGVTDGLSNTLFFGERNHFDPNYDTSRLRAGRFFRQTMGMWGWWASSSGGYGLSDVAESTFARSTTWSRLPTAARLPRRLDHEPVHDRLMSTLGSTRSAVSTQGVRTSPWSTARYGSSSRRSRSRPTTPWEREPAAKSSAPTPIDRSARSRVESPPAGDRFSLV